MSTASVDIRKSQVDLGISPDAFLSEDVDDPFHQRTTILNVYLISKLNASLHDTSCKGSSIIMDLKYTD